MAFDSTVAFFFVFFSMMSIGYSLRRRNTYTENPNITDHETDGYSLTWTNKYIENPTARKFGNLTFFTECTSSIIEEKYFQETAKTIIPYYMCEFCQSHCVNYTYMQFQYVLKPHIEKKNQNTLVPIHIILQCSVWRYIIEDTKWLINLPEDIHSLFFENTTILRCRFEKHVFQKCLETIALSAFNTSSITCLSEGFNVQSYLVFKSQCTKHLSYNIEYSQFIYPLISLIFFIVIIICICKRSKACHEFNRFFNRNNNFSNVNIYHFDAFISYSHHDVEWVLKFYKRLEEMELKICLDAKDFEPGAFIFANIENAFNESRNAIFIMTENFLASEWGSYELKTAHTYMQKKKLQDIIIVLNLRNDIRFYELPNVLEQVLTYASCIKWLQSEERSNNCQESDCYKKIYKVLSKNKITVV